MGFVNEDFGWGVVNRDALQSRKSRVKQTTGG